MSPQYLPQEIVTEILSWLPSKSLLRFTLVCKSWQSLITNPSFISLHHRHSSSFILLNYTKHPFDPKACHIPYQSSVRHDNPLLTPASNSSLTLPDGTILAMYHGLICLSENRQCSSLIICNPSLRRFLSLPEPIPDNPKVKDAIRPWLFFGFGFDSRNQDYKLVRIVSESCWVSFSEAQVFSLASGFWKMLCPTIAPFCITSCNTTNNRHGLVNGLIHWGARRTVGQGYYLFILSFDFQHEVFHEVMLPKCLAHASSPMDMVTVVGGGNVDMDLTIYHLNLTDHYSGSIWVMKEYGVVKSWNKLFAYDLIDSCLQAPSWRITISNMNNNLPPAALCVMNNGGILLMWYHNSPGKKSLYLLDTGKKSLVDLRIQLFGGEIDYTWWYQYVGYYTESLVLLNNKVCAGALMSY